MWMLIFLLLPVLGLAYVGWHLWVLLPISAAGRCVLIGILLLSFLLLFCNFWRVTDRLPLGLARCVYDIGSSSVFILLYLVMIFLLLDLLRLLHVMPCAWLRDSFPMSAAITLFLFILFLSGNHHYHNKVREELHLSTQKPLSKPLKLVMMSDLHLGYHNPKAELSRWIDMVNAEKPDLVLIAGDIIDMSMRPLLEENMAEEFLRIEAPIYACLGNHEYYSGQPEAQLFYKQAHIHLLRDTTETIGDICIIGRDDRTNYGRKDVAVLAREADMDKYTILLDHQPYHLERTERAGIDFQLSGHTHHGQVWPISWITERLYECAFGSYQRGDTHYYISSGIGIWGGKFRIGTRSEYVVAYITNDI